MLALQPRIEAALQFGQLSRQRAVHLFELGAQFALALDHRFFEVRRGDRLALAAFAQVRVDVLAQVGEARSLGRVREVALGFQGLGLAPVFHQVARFLRGAADEECQQRQPAARRAG